MEAAKKNAVTLGSCVQRTMDDILSGRGDAAIVELRLTRLPAFAGRMDVVPIDQGLFPPPPMTFTVGVMTSTKKRPLAEAYAAHLLSPAGQAQFERMGFVPALSNKGQQLVEKYGVKDV